MYMKMKVCIRIFSDIRFFVFVLFVNFEKTNQT